MKTKKLTVLFIIGMISLLIFYWFLFRDLGEKYSLGLNLPDGPKVLKNLSPNQVIILQKDMSFTLPEGARIVGAGGGVGKDGGVSVCIEGITDINKFMKENAFVEDAYKRDWNYYSLIINKEFDSNQCEYYTGTNTKRGFKSKRKIVGYSYDGVYYVEVISPTYYEKETYEMFFNRQE